MLAPTPELETFAEAWTKAAAAAFTEIVDPQGTLVLADLRMVDEGEMASAGKTLVWRTADIAGVPSGFIITSADDELPIPPQVAGDKDDGAAVFERFVQALVARLAWKQPGKLKLAPAEPERWTMKREAASVCALNLRATAQKQEFGVDFYFSDSFCRALKLGAQDKQDPQQGRGGDLDGNSHPNIARILDLELGITVCFGSTRMPIKNVLQLGAGSIVELDRLVDEPVEVWVNRKRVASGEIVIVDGNYGIRISEVDPVAERIQSLGG